MWCKEHVLNFVYSEEYTFPISFVLRMSLVVSLRSEYEVNILFSVCETQNKICLKINLDVVLILRIKVAGFSVYLTSLSQLLRLYIALMK